MDWVAVGSLATVALVAVGFIQARATKKTQAQTPAYSSPASLVTAAPSPPPVFHYRFDIGHGSYPFPPEWASDLMDARYIQDITIGSDLSDFSFGTLSLQNRTENTVYRLCIDVSAGKVWSANVQSTRFVSPNAVGILAVANGARIEIAELPAKEDVRIAVCGRALSSFVSSANAAVKLKRAEDWYD